MNGITRRELENTRNLNHISQSQLTVTISELIDALTEIVGYRNPDTKIHMEKVGKYAQDIARKMRLPMKSEEITWLAGLLHDIGKISLPESILLKPGYLTMNEFNKVKQHPVTGAKILSNIFAFHKVAPIVLHHHERLDGRGYPEGLKGEKIPLASRIIAVADAFDAMTSDRPYRKAMSIADACQVLEDTAGTQFDPEVISIFLNLLNV